MFVRNTPNPTVPEATKNVVMPSCLSEELRDDERVVKAAVAQYGAPTESCRHFFRLVVPI